MSDRLEFESFGNFDIYVANRQFTFESAINVGVWSVTEEKVGTIILEPVVVNFVSVTVWWEVKRWSRKSAQWDKWNRCLSEAS